MILGEEQYNGSYTKNGLKFDHFNVTNMLVKCNGRATEISTDFPNKRYQVAYDAMFSQVNVVNPLFNWQNFDELKNLKK